MGVIDGLLAVPGIHAKVAKQCLRYAVKQQILDRGIMLDWRAVWVLRAARAMIQNGKLPTITRIVCSLAGGTTVDHTFDR
jgi:hypothetical protein